jgi:hypothetical protein
MMRATDWNRPIIRLAGGVTHVLGIIRYLCTRNGPWRAFIARRSKTCRALESEDIEQCEAAREALRGFVAAIMIPRDQGLLQVRGDLGAMLAAGRQRTGRSGAGGCRYKWLRGLATALV